MNLRHPWTIKQIDHPSGQAYDILCEHGRHTAVLYPDGRIILNPSITGYNVATESNLTDGDKCWIADDQRRDD